MTTRFPKWRSALSEYFERVRQQPFVYGSSDCACFAAGAVDAMTGVDPMADIKKQYSSVIGAKRLLKKSGALSLGDFVSRSFKEIHPSQGCMGDLGLIKTDGPFGGALGIFSGERVMAMTTHGLDSVDRAEIIRAWRI